MFRWLRLAGTALFALAVYGSSAQAAGSATIGFRPGGDVYTYIAQALDMLRGGKSYRVIGDQFSAAALQVIYLENQMPGRICASPKAKLHFHLGFDKETGRPMKKPDVVWVTLIGPKNLKRLGKLPEYGTGFKTVKASDYLGLCK
ncbi:hypothetical protein [Taklimakanibacter albus]|jgi:hypothetical protein|uniref:Uncharacterized protein n=1 Tax=Taklimakanibacter albus TaxID=2800327 RepID=A0ACC5R943_9HYPH|nr:hypothetical protein [Aestuariivirga sp. YIM B02566]MBK1869191.1 hypothetical protein [Aestuariivirga sp. YIM B02566]